MKQIRNISAVILAAVLCFAAVSCTSTEPEVVPEYEISELANDLGGFEMIYSCSNNNTYYENILGYLPNTALADKAAQRLADVQKEYNCVITLDSTDHGTSYNRMYESVLSGIRYCDAIQNETYKMITAARAGYLEGLSQYFDMSDTEKWGTPGMLQSMCWDDDVYGILPALWPDLLYMSIGYPICVNENLVAQFGCSDPREYVENNTWTWDQFESSIQEYTRTEGDRKIYGVAFGDAYFAQMMLLSNGDSLVEEQNGKVICGIFTPTAKEALERAQSMYYVTSADCFYPETQIQNASDSFANGDIVLYGTDSNQIMGTSESVLYRVDNVGILPIPLGPHAKPGEYKSMYQSMLYSISLPVTCSDFTATALVLDALYEPLDGFETEESVIDYMAHSVFFDERDVGVIVNMLKNTEYAFFLEHARYALESVIKTQDSVTKVLESYTGTYDAIVEDYMEHHYRGQQAVWGN